LYINIYIFKIYHHYQQGYPGGQLDTLIALLKRKKNLILQGPPGVHQDKHGLGNVAGMLLYARTDEAFIPDCAFTISGNKIMIKTLDLNLEFKHIAAQLDGIAESVRRSSQSEKAARRTTPSVM
jgi:hypothetical protein